jgi:hypothetical protein
VNNLFVGNKLASGDVRGAEDQHFDLKRVRSPIIVFASMGDNITPPQQAFNWIADVYESTEDIKAHGQTIVGLLHEDIGHLGIFVSGQVAKKEHTQIVEVLNYIQELPPGLYGMRIEEHPQKDGSVTYDVTLKERALEDLRQLQKYDRVDEKPFEAVAAVSELLERAYSLLARPFVRAMVPEWSANLLREMHPLRVQHWAISDRNPWLWPLKSLAAATKERRKPRAKDNDAVRYEQLQSQMVSAALDLYRDLRDARTEAAFFQVYGNMFSLQMADERAESKRKTRFDPRALPAVREVLDTIEHGNAVDGLARIAMLVTKAGAGTHRLSQMQRTRDILSPEGEIAHLSEDERRRLLQEETIVVEFEPLRAKLSLPKVLRTASERRRAHVLLDDIVRHVTLDDRQRALVTEIRRLLPAPVAAVSKVAAAAKRLPVPRRGRAVTLKVVAPSGKANGKANGSAKVATAGTRGATGSTRKPVTRRARASA